MARVTDEAGTRVEHFLDYSLREWGAVPSYVAEFSTWDEEIRLAFVHEWAIRESGLETLADLARRGLLTPDQRRRYDHLFALVERHRPAIERLLAD
jgi:hypothetical protein